MGPITQTTDHSDKTQAYRTFWTFCCQRPPQFAIMLARSFDLPSIQPQKVPQTPRKSCVAVWFRCFPDGGPNRKQKSGTSSRTGLWGEFYHAIRAVLEVLRVLSTDFWWVRAHSCYDSRVWSVSRRSVALLRNATARRGATDAGNSVGVLSLAGRFS